MDEKGCYREDDRFMGIAFETGTTIWSTRRQPYANEVFSYQWKLLECFPVGP
jgi:hypothetical protein